MAELLIRVIDKTHPTDVYMNARLTKAGDVIVVCDDGHCWGDMEISNPEWRILKVAGKKEDFFHLLTPEQGDLRENPMLQARQFKIDLDLLAKDEAQAIRDARPEKDKESAAQVLKIAIESIAIAKLETKFDADEIIPEADITAARAESHRELIDADAITVDPANLDAARVEKPRLKDPFTLDAEAADAFELAP